MIGVLEEIGFYTLSEARAASASPASPLWRCELLLTDRCNFRCPYCRGMRADLKGSKALAEAIAIVDTWADQGLRHVRFSGGEPTVWPGLVDLVRHTKARGVRRIALSTNGSATAAFYDKLIGAGVDDFSISLDACCASYGDLMAGVPGAWNRVVENIRHVAAQVYTTVGVVYSSDTAGTVGDIIRFAYGLGVDDIRVISSAQYNRGLGAIYVDTAALDKLPILRYRMWRARQGLPVRGLCSSDSRGCRLAIDDMAVAGTKHFPCIIYLREGGDAIGDVGPAVRQDRARWVREHDTHADPICSANCLDVCVAYNNRASRRKSP